MPPMRSTMRSSMTTAPSLRAGLMPLAGSLSTEKRGKAREMRRDQRHQRVDVAVRQERQHRHAAGADAERAAAADMQIVRLDRKAADLAVEIRDFDAAADAEQHRVLGLHRQAHQTRPRELRDVRHLARRDRDRRAPPARAHRACSPARRRTKPSWHSVSRMRSAVTLLSVADSAIAVSRIGLPDDKRAQNRADFLRRVNRNDGCNAFVSVNFRSRLAHDRRPFLNFVANVSGEFRDRGRPRRCGERGEALFHQRCRQRLDDLAIEFLDDVGRRAGRRHQSIPCRDFVAGEAGLRDGRNVRQQRDRARGWSPPSARSCTGLHMRQGRHRGVEHQLDTWPAM